METTVRIPTMPFAMALLCICAIAPMQSASAATGGVAEMAKLNKQFASPSAEYRALPMSFDHKAPEQYADWLVKGGWGGAHFSYPDGHAYLQDQTGWDMFAASLNACKSRGLKVWIYDEAGYPSGRAGGLTLKNHPEYEAQGLFYASTDAACEKAGPFTWKLPDGKPFYVALCGIDMAGGLTGDVIDVTDKVTDGVLSVDMQPGDWRVVAFVQNRLYEATHAPLTGGPYINIMDPDAVKRFIEVTYDAYYQHCGDEFGKTITAIFTDEPSVMGGYLKTGTQPYPALSWYHGLPELFKKRAGYDIRLALPALFNQVGAQTVQRRCDFYSTISHAIADSYFGQIGDWCSEHKIAFTGHLLWEESLIYHANFYGSMFPSLARMDWPGIDVLGCDYGCTSGARTEGGPVTPKIISSVAHLYNKPRTMSESFCFVTDKTPVGDMLSHVGWQWTLGINSLTTLSIQEAGFEPAAFRRLNDYTGRLGYALTQGRFVADVAILYPIASVWADFSPTVHHVSYLWDNPKAKDVDDAWQSATREVLACQRDFDYLDESNIESASVSGGKIAIGGNRYSVLVLPGVSTLRYSTLQQIAKFVRGGGTVISLEAIPSNREDAGPIEEFNRLVSDLWDGNGARKGKVVHAETPLAFERALLAGDADVRVSPRTPDVYYQHRALPNGDIYFVLNNSEQALSGTFTFRATGRAEVWDPKDGKTTPILVKNKAGFSTLALTLPRRNGLLVVFSR